MNKEINPAVNRELAVKVLSIVDRGLVRGLGIRKAGLMCVEAAVCFAMGLPHSDNPTCVSPAVRQWKIGLNDSNWSSDKARAAGMRKVAVAQLGSNVISDVQFTQVLALRTVQVIVPMALREAAKIQSAHHKAILEDHAQKCESVGDLTEAARAASDAASDTARAASDAASDTARAASDAASDAASWAARAASWAASDTASDAARAARAASDTASWAASDAARAARAASDTASDAASDTASDTASWAASDAVLQKSAEVGLEALKECGSPGIEYLDLCED